MDYKEQLTERLRQSYQGKKILILGFGREGRTTYQFLRRLLKEQTLWIMDENPMEESDEIFWTEEGRDKRLVLLWGEEYLHDLDSYDLIFKTPGLPGYLLKGVKREKITSQTNEFVRHIGEKVIGITGTKGKSTTSTLVYETLKALGQEVLLVGNIGKPALSLLLEDNSNRIYVYEMSSHQTQYLRYAPRIAAILNLFEEHLDNYEDYEEYKQAKLRIGKAIFHAKAEEMPYPALFLFGADNEELTSYKRSWRNCRHKAFGHWKNRDKEEGIFLKDHEIVWVKKEKEEEKILPLGSADFPRHLLGEHNLINSLVAFLVVEEWMGLSPENIAETFKTIAEFKGLEHRLEYVGTYQGISFYNDSICTIPAAAKEAIRSIPNLQTMIIGGFDRGIHYQPLIEVLNNHPELRMICLPDTGHKIFPKLHHSHKKMAEDMSEAVALAYDMTESGKACALSPAAASYTFYKNFEERGSDFKEKVIAFGR